jgi:hypothetical protein
MFTIHPLGVARTRLLPKAKPCDDLLVTVVILAFEVVQEAPALPHHLEQALPGMMVLAVNLEVLREVEDPLGKERDLDFR